jgi:antitoxin component YwqK of YwqJK toxin-antitoxin module
MKTKVYLLLASLGLIVCGCKGDKKDDNVVSQRYVHKYGYQVSKEDWETGKYPGQVITTLRNGVTVTATYDGGVLHGPSTHTYPHSQTIEAFYLYNQGNLIKETIYDIKGMPLSETIQLSPTRHTQTLWYTDGSPLCIEEFVGDELLEGQYFSTHNETESRVEKGTGLRVRRDRDGTLLSKDEVESGYMTKSESFYPTGAPESIAYYARNKLSGLQTTFAVNGEPLSSAEWINGQLHGKCTYYKNGAKYLEISYMNDQKNGMETHFLPDGKISQETLWENNKRHGQTVYHINEGENLTEWYYDGKKVSQEEFKDLNRVDEIISQIPSSVHNVE